MSLQEQLEETVHDFIIESLGSQLSRAPDTFDSNPLWEAMRQAGSRLWLDTGSITEASDLWAREFAALTTNNTLLNREIQNGQYDDLIPRASEMLDEFRLSKDELLLEIAFILNAVHGLKLVQRFGAFVSVEEHTDLADDVSRAVSYGLRYHAICPEHFIVKLPLTPAGLLATRRLSDAGVPVNHTLGFSARQNVAIARIGRPAYVNVFMGRLNSVVADNGLGDGSMVGEKATIASQTALRSLNGNTLQIGASIRSGEQVRDVAGVDVLTIPPKAAQQFIDLGQRKEDIRDRTADTVTPGISIGAEAAGIHTLWDINDAVVQCLDALEKEDLLHMSPAELVQFFSEHGAGDLLVPWSEEQRATSRREGKIPDLKNWSELLVKKQIGLDALMNLGGLSAFKADQASMDDHVSEILEDMEDE